MKKNVSSGIPHTAVDREYEVEPIVPSFALLGGSIDNRCSGRAGGDVANIDN